MNFNYLWSLLGGLFFSATGWNQCDISATATATNVLCTGAINGAITIDYTNAGTAGAPYTITLTGGGGGVQTSPTESGSVTFSNLGFGTYSILIEGSSCTFTISGISVTEPIMLISTVTVVPATMGLDNGQISVFTSGGMPPYSYSIDGGISFQASSLFTDLPAGVYLVVVQDANGCLVLASGGGWTPVPLICDCSSLIIGVDVTPSIPGNNDGEIELSVSGGTPPYQFSIDNMGTWQSSNMFTGLAGDTYIVWVQDAAGCMTSETVVVSDDPVCDFNLVTSSSSMICTATCDESISYSFSDGVNNAPYTIQLLQGSSILQTNTVSSGTSGFGGFNNLCTGAYTVRVTGSNGCSNEEIIDVFDTGEMDIVLISYGEATLGINDGYFEAEAINGLGPYTYSIDGIGGPTTQIGNGWWGNLYEGCYTLHVFDANGCLDSFLICVNATTCNFNASLTIVSEISCAGACTGALHYDYADASNNPPYTLSITLEGMTLPAFETTQTTSTFTGDLVGLCPGNYKMVVSNGNGCYVTEEVLLEEPMLMQAYATTTQTAVGTSDGSVQLESYGGTGAHTYSLNGVDFQSSGLFENLAMGLYTASVKDANDCLIEILFTITEGTSCSAAFSAMPASQVSCNACDGGISFSYNDAGTSSNYTVELSNESGVVLDQLTFTCSAASGSFDDLCSGVYAVTLTDDNGCVTTETIELTSTSIDLVVVQVEPTFGQADGSITATASGGTPPYQYSIDNMTSFQSSNVFSNLLAGSYDVCVMDANGCFQCTAVTLIESPLVCDLTFSAQVNAGILCSGLCEGSIDFSFADANLSSSYTVSLHDGLSVIDQFIFTTGNAASGTFNNVCAGVYVVMIDADNGCTDADTFDLVQPDALVIATTLVHPTVGNTDGAVTITVSGGTTPYQYSADNLTWQPSNIFNNLAAGTYTFYVKDANGCLQTVTVILNDSNISVAEIQGEAFLVYPNPTQGIVFVSAANIQAVTVYDVSGKMTQVPYSSAGNGFTLDFGTVASGTYVVEMISVNGAVNRIRVVRK